ncbi:energy-converting hydrogenase Eha subunit F [Clostridiales Family XIII bacterium PM5-7]
MKWELPLTPSNHCAKIFNDRKLYTKPMIQSSIRQKLPVKRAADGGIAVANVPVNGLMRANRTAFCSVWTTGFDRNIE